MKTPTLKLSVPIDIPERDGAPEIVFRRRMNAGDLSAVGLSLSLKEADLSLSAEQVNEIASRCTGLPVKCLEAMDASDWMNLYAEVAGFFAPPSTSGEAG